MNEVLDRREVGAPAYARWLCATWILSAMSLAGLASTISRPASHPVILACSLSWLIALAVSAVTRDGLVRMNPKRFRFARWERQGQVYRRVGVAGFCWLLLHTPLGWTNPWLKLNRGRAGIEQLLREMNYAEGAHLIGGLITLGFAVGYAATGHTSVGLWLGLLTIVVHAYPVMVQRWNRGRVLRVADRLDALAQSGQRDRDDPLLAEIKKGPK